MTGSAAALLPLALSLVWLIAANVIAMFPSRDKHWRVAYVLIAVGVPILGWATWESGPVVGLLLLAAGASILRWPVVFFWRWLRRQAG
ncbi:MAG: DUF2484 family protein [Tabrizicola sp.]|jgi:hypothetical protein|uniref:DUF2484 family protein n=1 Tax=Tabrizicola sp. TaxID=2005166 RepID=UPI001B746AED|nr:DUF2484 family protein [Fuscovulum sp.]MCC6517259.1 DUF2484 family protein [Tabrizicola sp.]